MSYTRGGWGWEDPGGYLGFPRQQGYLRYTSGPSGWGIYPGLPQHIPSRVYWMRRNHERLAFFECPWRTPRQSIEEITDQMYDLLDRLEDQRGQRLRDVWIPSCAEISAYIDLLKQSYE